MIYCNKIIVIPGPNGLIKDYVFSPPEIQTKSKSKAKITDQEQPKDPAQFLGDIDGLRYRYFADGTDMASVGEQDPEIDFKQVTLTPEQMSALRDQYILRAKKDAMRKKIELEVGDYLDLLADNYKLSEFAIVAVSVLLADKAGIVPLDDETLKAYGQRGAAVLQSIQSGALTLRASYEDPSAMILQILPKYTRLQQITRDEYIEPLRSMGLYPDNK